MPELSVHPAVSRLAATMRSGGVKVGVGDLLAAHRALAAVDASQREEAFYALRAALCASHADMAVFAEGFALAFAALAAPEAAPAGAGRKHAAALDRLREAAEEVGLDPGGGDVVGTLPEVFIERTGFRVVPVLAWWRKPSAVAPVDAGEVAAVERVSVAELADPATRLMFRMGGRGGPAFRVRGMLIWGFTALLVDRLLALGGWEKPWDAGVVADM